MVEPIGAIDDIAREPVESSTIHAIGYSYAKQTLAVEFKRGDIFHYSPVDLDLATAFYAAESKGKFYSTQIRGKIPSKLMTGPCASCGINGPIGTTCTDCGCNVHVERERRRLTEEEKAIEARESRR